MTNGSPTSVNEAFFQKYNLIDIIDDYCASLDKGGSTIYAVGVGSIINKCQQIDRKVAYWAIEKELDSLIENEQVITFKRNEASSLWEFGSSQSKAVITVDAIFNAAAKRNLNPVQEREIEGLLNKAGRSLQTTLAPVKQADDKDMMKALMPILISSLLNYKPRLAYFDFVETLRRSGLEIDMTEKDFRAYLETL